MATSRRTDLHWGCPPKLNMRHQETSALKCGICKLFAHRTCCLCAEAWTTKQLAGILDNSEQLSAAPDGRVEMPSMLTSGQGRLAHGPIEC